MEGWIKLHRNLMSNPQFSDGDWLKVWLFLLLNATHAPLDRMFGGDRITLEPGQLITSRGAISANVSVQESKVERILKRMKSEQQIEQQADNRSRLITVRNWKQYQQDEQQDEHPVNSDRTAGEHPVNTHKNIRTKEVPSQGDPTGRELPLCTIEQARTAAGQEGFDPDSGETWWHEVDARGWIDPKGHQIKNWRSSLRAYCRKWRTNDRARNGSAAPSKAKAKHVARGQFGI